MENSEKMITNLTIWVLSILFAIANIVPIFGSGSVSYIFGRNEDRNKRYNLTRAHYFVAMVAGGLIYFTIGLLIVGTTIKLENPKTAWSIAITYFAINYLFSIILYLIGYRQSKIKNK